MRRLFLALIVTTLSACSRPIGCGQVIRVQVGKWNESRHVLVRMAEDNRLETANSDNAVLIGVGDTACLQRDPSGYRTVKSWNVASHNTEDR